MVLSSKIEVITVGNNAGRLQAGAVGYIGHIAPLLPPKKPYASNVLLKILREKCSIRKGTTVTALHMGVVFTKLSKNGKPTVTYRNVNNILLQPPPIFRGEVEKILETIHEIGPSSIKANIKGPLTHISISTPFVVTVPILERKNLLMLELHQLAAKLQCEIKTMRHYNKSMLMGRVPRNEEKRKSSIFNVYPMDTARVSRERWAFLRQGILHTNLTPEQGQLIRKELIASYVKYRMYRSLLHHSRDPFFTNREINDLYLQPKAPQQHLHNAWYYRGLMLLHEEFWPPDRKLKNYLKYRKVLRSLATE